MTITIATEALGEDLFNHRRDLSLTRRQVADRTGVSETVLTNLENHNRRGEALAVKTLAALCHYFGVPMEKYVQVEGRPVAERPGAHAEFRFYVRAGQYRWRLLRANGWVVKESRTSWGKPYLCFLSAQKSGFKGDYKSIVWKRDFGKGSQED